MRQVTEKRLLIVRGAAAASAVWLAAILLAPFLARATDWLAAVPYLVGSLVCHQQPERTFHLAGAQLPVCARCTGLYLGAALGLGAWASRARRRRAGWPRASALVALAASGAPTALTVATAWLSVADASNPWRAVFAVPLGVVAGRVVGAVITDHLK
jgi:uncharacterized membrane protein